MKKFLPTIILVCALVFFIDRFFWRDSDINTGDRSVISRDFQIDPTVVELSTDLAKMGKVQMGKLKDVFFTIYNIGGAELVIEDIEGDCFCTVPVWEDIEVAPGDSTRFSVRITKEEKGFFQQNVLVHGNFPDSPKIVRIQGEIVE